MIETHTRFSISCAPRPSPYPPNQTPTKSGFHSTSFLRIYWGLSLLLLHYPFPHLKPHIPFNPAQKPLLGLQCTSPSQWQAVSPSEKTPDLKRALRTLLSKMKVKWMDSHTECSHLFPPRKLALLLYLAASGGLGVSQRLTANSTAIKLFSQSHKVRHDLLRNM